MAIRIFSFTRSWPIKSIIFLGRTLASTRASSSKALPERIRRGDSAMESLLRAWRAEGFMQRLAHPASRDGSIAGAKLEVTSQSSHSARSFRFAVHPRRPFQPPDDRNLGSPEPK